TVADYAGALRLMRRRAQDPIDFPKAMAVSALEEKGLAEAWSEMSALADWRRSEGWWDTTRAAQAVHWFEAEVREGLLARLHAPEVQARMAELAEAVAAGRMSAEAAALVALEG
ncbi:MAG: methylmalonyl Co-A mutase-associated GTPase MeaB, partial [Pseudomonadota bacterium]